MPGKRCVFKIPASGRLPERRCRRMVDDRRQKISGPSGNELFCWQHRRREFGVDIAPSKVGPRSKSNYGLFAYRDFQIDDKLAEYRGKVLFGNTTDEHSPFETDDYVMDVDDRGQFAVMTKGKQPTLFVDGNPRRAERVGAAPFANMCRKTDKHCKNNVEVSWEVEDGYMVDIQFERLDARTESKIQPRDEDYKWLEQFVDTRNYKDSRSIKKWVKDAGMRWSKDTSGSVGQRRWWSSFRPTGEVPSLVNNTKYPPVPLPKYWKPVVSTLKLTGPGVMKPKRKPIKATIKKPVELYLDYGENYKFGTGSSKPKSKSVVIRSSTQVNTPVSRDELEQLRKALCQIPPKSLNDKRIAELLNKMGNEVTKKNLISRGVFKTVVDKKGWIDGIALNYVLYQAGREKNVFVLNSASGPGVTTERWLRDSFASNTGFKRRGHDEKLKHVRANYSRFMAPVHVNRGTHWILLVGEVDPRTNRLNAYVIDSLEKDHRETVRRQANVIAEIAGVPLGRIGNKASKMKQKDGYNCGAHTVINAYDWLKIPTSTCNSMRLHIFMTVLCNETFI